MDTRHPLPLLLLAVAFVGCRQDVPTSLEHRGPLFSAAQSSAATWIVDDDAAECPGAQFTSIQAAVDAADPGSTILVCAGTYREQVRITKNELRLRARGERGDVVLDGLGLSVRFAGFLLDNAHGNLIEGFLLRNYHEASIWLGTGSSGNTIRTNVTTAADHDGIQLLNADDNLIEHNVAMDNLAPNACGINVTAGSERNVVRRNRLVNNEWGIQIAGTPTATTRDNMISNNTSLGNRGNGIRNLGGTSGTLIEGNHAGRNGLAPGALTGGTAAGVRVASGTGIVVRGNHAFGNRLVDLLKEAAATATFSDNRCGTSSPDGLCERGRPTTSP
jgi:parallel beta-helix repeat protein